MKNMKLQMLGFAILLAGSAAQAFPPRMHSERGTVKAIDPKGQTVTLQVCCATKEFALRQWTRIRIDGQKLPPTDVPIGASVRISYRREMGERALYEVRSTTRVTTCSDCIAQKALAKCTNGSR